jgi:dephospho-CoA kinase
MPRPTSGQPSNGKVIGFSGPIASGKTMLAREFQRGSKSPYTSFGDYVRKVAVERGRDPHSREVLQTLGLNLIDELRVTGFCQAVLDQAHFIPGHSLILDGIRREDSLPVLKQIIAPSDFLLVYVDIDEGTRIERLRARGVDCSPEAIKRIQEHPTEIEVATIIRKAADLIVDGSQPLSELVDQVARLILEKSKT